jgi:outer membrane lipoprotein carrier protein
LEACRRTDSAKCSPRRLRVSIELAAVFALALAQGAGAQPESANERGVATLDAFLSGVRSLTADFKQELYGPDEHLLQTQSGKLSLQRPNRFRWSYAAPTELVVVADGKKLWMYDVELAQVTVAPLDDTVGSSPAMLLSGDRSVRDEFDVVRSFTRDGLDWVQLAPKTDAADFRSITIGFEGAAPRRLELVDGLNQITRIVLANVALNPELGDGVFEFTPPAGVDVIGGKG